MWSIEDKGTKVTDIIERAILGRYTRYLGNGNGLELERTVERRIDYRWLCKEWIVGQLVRYCVKLGK